MIFDEIKFIFQKFFGARYKITGACKQCGKCCSEIRFINGNCYVATNEQFEALKRFDKRYNNFEISGFDDEKKSLLFRCKALSDNGKCKFYHFRSIACRIYPKPSKKFLLGGGKLLDGCGYKIETTKNFEEFLTQ